MEAIVVVVVVVFGGGAPPACECLPPTTAPPGEQMSPAGDACPHTVLRAVAFGSIAATLGSSFPEPITFSTRSLLVAFTVPIFETTAVISIIIAIASTSRETSL